MGDSISPRTDASAFSREPSPTLLRLSEVGDGQNAETRLHLAVAWEEIVDIVVTLEGIAKRRTVLNSADRHFVYFGHEHLQTGSTNGQVHRAVLVAPNYTAQLDGQNLRDQETLELPFYDGLESRWTYRRVFKSTPSFFKVGPVKSLSVLHDVAKGKQARAPLVFFSDSVNTYAFEGEVEAYRSRPESPTPDVRLDLGEVPNYNVPARKPLSDFRAVGTQVQPVAPGDDRFSSQSRVAVDLLGIQPDIVSGRRVPPPAPLSLCGATSFFDGEAATSFRSPGMQDSDWKVFVGIFSQGASGSPVAARAIATGKEGSGRQVALTDPSATILARPSSYPSASQIQRAVARSLLR